MFKIEDDLIKITRGDKGVIELTIKDYTFNVDDKIEFRVYLKKGLDKEPVLSNQTIVNTASESVDITLTSEETKIGNILNKPVDYWYEIELNDEDTVIGYDENGPKIFRLYPEGVGE